MARPSRYSADFRARAMRLVAEAGPEHDTEWAAITSVANKLGVSSETLRKWIRQSEVDTGRRPGTTSDESAELKRLRRENAELRRANEILKAASAFFRRGARPPRAEMIRFVDEHKDRFGVEPLIGVLRGTDAGFLSVSGYYAAKTRPPSARAIADAALAKPITAVHEANYSVYGVRKMHDALRREDVPIGRDHLARLMRRLGLAGVRRGKPKRTTIADTAAARPADLVRRQFSAARPNQLWVCDLTYIRTWVGFAYLALVIDVYSRRLVGWALTTHLRTDLPLEALEMAVWARNERLDGLIHHSDAGSQYTAIRYTDTLAGVGALPSVGSVGDSYDNALAESTIGQIKTELIHRRGPWRSVEQLEYALFEYIDWWNHRRLHGEIGMRTPAETEAAHYAQTASLTEAGTQ
ncbi:MAG TPA: IS3 family transposase [Actinoplanes sp.]|nr:IS3 family transposase [Actinoplanes sp.]